MLASSTIHAVHIRCKYHTCVYLRQSRHLSLSLFFHLCDWPISYEFHVCVLKFHQHNASKSSMSIALGVLYQTHVPHTRKNPLNLSACHESAHYMHFDRQNNHKTPKVFLSFFKNGMYPITFLSILGALANNTLSMIVLSGIRSLCVHRNGTRQIIFLFGFDFIVCVFVLFAFIRIKCQQTINVPLSECISFHFDFHLICFLFHFQRFLCFFLLLFLRKGAHINPAVTFGMLVSGAISLFRAVMYATAQCGGAIGAAALLYR